MGTKDIKKESSTSPNSSGAERLSQEIDLLKNGVADDLAAIRDGKVDNLKYICFNKDNKNYNMLKVIMDSIKLLEEPNKGVRPKKTEPEPDIVVPEPEIQESVKDNGNVFEFVSKRLLEKRVNGK